MGRAFNWHKLMKDGPELSGALSYSLMSPSFVCSILMDGIVVGADAMSVMLIAALMKSIAGAGRIRHGFQ